MFETGYTIQTARPDDLPGVVACLAAAFEPYRASYTPSAFADTVPTVEACGRRLKEMTILVAKEGSGMIVGTIACQRVAPGEGHLRDMAVQPGIEGRGVAKNLLAAAEAELHALDCVRVTLDTTEPLGRAIHFYEEHGYAPTGTVTDFFGMPLFEYAKDL